MEEQMKLPMTLPILPLINRVFLPHCVMRIVANEPASVKLIEDYVWEQKNRLVGIVPQQSDSAPLHRNGCAARILKVSRQPSVNGVYSYIMHLEGMTRIRLGELKQSAPYVVSAVDVYDLAMKGEAISSSAAEEFKSTARELVAMLSSRLHLTDRLKEMIDQLPVERLCDIFASSVDASYPERLAILDSPRPSERLELAATLLNRQIKLLRISTALVANQSVEDSKKDVSSATNQEVDEFKELELRLQKAQLPEAASKVAIRELNRLRHLQSSQSEYGVLRNYLDWLAELPWNSSTVDSTDLTKAQAILDADHFGLEKIKKRLLEFLAVRALRPNLPSPILCFVGPPGTGKTSLGKSIAQNLDRKYARIALGGVRDEAEVRGHRRTYVGALPGRIVTALKQVQVNNPVILLDEIDKLGRDMRGDPASALLEVLDPEQNCAFVDTFLGVPFDLSRVLFVATANDLSGIPAALIDRVEVIELSGYTLEEKTDIAQRYLWPKQCERHGLTDLTITQSALQTVISHYTREAGVRNLERELASICRAFALKRVKQQTRAHQAISEADIFDILGSIKFDSERATAFAAPGIATGLAWTAVGGKIMFVEAVQCPGTGKIALTGQLGDVMKESAEIALTWVKANFLRCGLSSQTVLTSTDIHVHFPTGSTPKDGPSAGVTLACVLVSLLGGKTVRVDTAMTGELTLTGRVLPVGGIKEKVLAAYRAGISRVILPARNQRELKDIPESIQAKIEFILVDHLEQVLDAALTGGCEGCFSQSLVSSKL